MDKYTELIERHGTLKEFEEACERAVDDFFITWEEKERAVKKYRKELKEAKQK